MVRRPQVYEIDDFSGGLDLRDQVFSRADHTARVFRNVWVRGKKVVMRPPLGTTEDAQSALTQGQLAIGETLYTFAPCGAVASPISLDSGAVTVEVLEFDQPDGATGTWELLAAVVYNGKAVAAIRHAFNSAAAPWLTLLHVFDGDSRSFTYVQGEGVPSNWGPDIADPEATYYPDWQPRFGLAGGKLWVSGPDGLAHFCATNRPRVWNDATAADIGDQGEHFYFMVPDHAAAATVAVNVPVVHADLDPSLLGGNPFETEDGYRYWSYVLQYHDGEGWTEFTEQTIAGDLQMSTAANASAGCKQIDATTITLRWDAAATGARRLRFKAIANRSQSGPGSGDWTIWGRTVTNVPVATGATSPVGDWISYLALNAAYAESRTDTINGSPYSRPNTLSTDLTGLLRYRNPFSDSYIWEGPVSTEARVVRKDDLWHANYLIRAADQLAGADDAGFLAPAATLPVSGPILGFSQLRNRIAMHYRDGTVLYLVDQDPANMEHLDFSPIGAASQTNLQPVSILATAILPTQKGMAGMFLERGTADGLRDLPLGAAIERLGVPTQLAAVWWPLLGVYLTAIDGANGLEWWALTLNRQEKVTAWAIWDSMAADLDLVPGSMQVVGNRVYFRSSDHRLWWFDGSAFAGSADAPPFTDPGAQPVEAELVLPFNAFGRPHEDKRVFALDIAQEGSCQVGYLPRPWDPSLQHELGTVSGITFGQSRVALDGTYRGLALRLVSTDPLGWELSALQVLFRSFRA